MKSSVKFIASAIAVCLTIGVLMVGIFAATSGGMELTSLVQWQSIGVEMNLNGKVTGNKSTDNIAKTYSDSLSLTDDSKVSAWSIGALNFVISENLTNQVKYSEPIVFRFGFTNTSENNVNIYYYFDTAPTVVQNINYEYQLAYGTLGSGETWETDFFSNSYSGSMQVSSTSSKYYAIHKDTEHNFVAPGETAVFEIRLIVASFSQSIATANFTPILKFQNTPREGGTLYNPYIISNEEDFNTYATSEYFGDPSLYFLQIDDLAFNTTATAQSLGAPRAAAVSEDNALTVTDLLAHYDGGNNTIDLTGTNSPLFNAVGSSLVTSASLSDLNVYNENSTASAGITNSLSGKIENCSFDGSITNTTETYVGGLVSQAQGSSSQIINCVNNASISGTSYIGGIIGGPASGSTISRCVNNGDISLSASASYKAIGGIVGYAGSLTSVTISNCYNTGAISGESYCGGVGGIMGLAMLTPTTISNCYNTGTISQLDTTSGYSAAGGILGGLLQESSGYIVTILNCFNLGTIECNDVVSGGETCSRGGGLFGQDVDLRYYYPEITNSFYLDASATSAIGMDATLYTGTAKTLTELQTQSTYANWTFNSSNWVWASAKIVVNGEEHCYWLPRLAFEDLVYGTPEHVSPDSGGSGSTPTYTIASTADFVKYATETSASGIGFANPDISFKQTADIVLASDYSNSYFGSTLLADYDGGGYTLRINPLNGYVVEPLFEAIGSSTATSITTNLKNLTIDYAAKESMSLFAKGFARDIYYTNVENVHTTGHATTVPVSDLMYSRPIYFGNIAYKATGSKFTNCSNSTDQLSISGSWYYGGLIGYAADVEMNYCWNESGMAVETSVSSGYIGGLVSYVSWTDRSSSFVMKNCYNTGYITVADTGTSVYIAGLVAYIVSQGTATIENCYNTGEMINSGTSSVVKGGLLGLVTATGDVVSSSQLNVTIKNCYNTGASAAMLHKIGVANSSYITNLTMDKCYSIGSGSGGYSYLIGSTTGASTGDTVSVTNSFNLSSSMSMSTLQTQSTYTNAGWTFGTYGTAKDGWVWRTASIVVDRGTFTYSLPRLWYEDLTAENVMNMLGFGDSSSVGVPTIYINGVEQTNIEVAGATTVGDYTAALDGKTYPGYFYDENLTTPANEDDVVTNDTKLYTKPATLDKLNFVSNGNGTCSVDGNNPSGDVIIPLVSPAGDSVTSIGDGAFADCGGLTSITIPDSVTSIRDGAFYFCGGLTSITIPDIVTSIGGSAFANCSGLTSITIPDSVTSIDYSAFANCSSLTSIYIPSSVTTISASSYSSSPFSSCSSTLKIYCGASSKPSGWGTYWNYYASEKTLSVTWGVTRATYNSTYA